MERHRAELAHLTTVPAHTYDHTIVFVDHGALDACRCEECNRSGLLPKLVLIYHDARYDTYVEECRLHDQNALTALAGALSMGDFKRMCAALYCTFVRPNPHFP